MMFNTFAINMRSLFMKIFSIGLTVLCVSFSAVSAADSIEGQECTLALNDSITQNLESAERNFGIFTQKGYRIVNDSQNPEFILTLNGPCCSIASPQYQNPTFLEHAGLAPEQIFYQLEYRLSRAQEFSLVLSDNQNKEFVRYKASATYARYHDKVFEKMNSKIPNCTTVR